MEPKTKTEELVELLKELYADDQYAGVSGYLQGVMMSLEKECDAPAKKLLDHYIEAVTEELSIKNNK
jgi:3-hydroxyacyl-CoA dehydrogenase